MIITTVIIMKNSKLLIVEIRFQDTFFVRYEGVRVKRNYWVSLTVYVH